MDWKIALLRCSGGFIWDLLTRPRAHTYVHMHSCRMDVQTTRSCNCAVGQASVALHAGQAIVCLDAERMGLGCLASLIPVVFTVLLMCAPGQPRRDTVRTLPSPF
jgi:hypothetical protein